MRRREVDVFYVASRLVLLFWLSLHISDLGLYLDDARKASVGHLWPYKGFDFEYPPLAYLLISLPAWLHDLVGLHQTETYRIFFGLTLLPFDVLLYFRYRRRPPFAGAAFAYVMLTCALGLLLFDRFDLVVGFLLAWPFLAEGPATDRRFALFWGLGGALKLVPLVAAPARALEWAGTPREKAWRLLRFGATTVGPLVVCCAAVAAFTQGRLTFLSHHSERGVQIESLLGSAVMLLHVFTRLITAKVEWNFGAQHLGPIPGLVTASRILFVGSLAATYGLLACPRYRRDSLSGAWLAISAFVTFGYVLSPQFLLWLVPIGLCAAGRVEEGPRRSIWLGIFAAAVVLTGNHFRFFWDYVNFHRPAVLLLFLRNLLLVGLWGLSWRWMGRPDGGKVPPYDSEGSS